MALDKLLHKIQEDIHELAKSLEFFMEDTIQPTVDECESLQKKLYLLQENLAVYKYNKSNKELSPSFNLHSKISEVEVKEPEQEPVIAEIKIVPAPEEKKKEEIPAPVIEEAPTRSVNVAPLSVGLNDKFRFINELFSQNNSEYAIAMEQLNNLKTWRDTEIYLNSLRDLYEWKTSQEVVKYLYALAKKRFD
jgi:hypothetical protein